MAPQEGLVCLVFFFMFVLFGGGRVSKNVPSFSKEKKIKKEKITYLLMILENLLSVRRHQKPCMG
jgi:hypothetical protein